MSNTNWKILSIIAFIISAIFTILLMTSGTVGILSLILTVGMAIVLELSKCGFLYEALANTKVNFAIRGVMGFISVLLVGASIFASSSYIQNQNNARANIRIQTSTQFKSLEEGKNIQKDLYTTKKEELKRLQNLQEQQKADGEQAVKSLPKDYISKKAETRQATANRISNTQKSIDNIQNELSGLTSELQKPIDTTNLQVKSENGYSAMFQGIAKFLNNTESYKNSPVNAESLEMWFFIVLGILFELIAVITFYLGNLDSVKANVESGENKKPYNIGYKQQSFATARKQDSNDRDNTIKSHLQEEGPLEQKDEQEPEVKRKIGFECKSSMKKEIEPQAKQGQGVEIDNVDNEIIRAYVKRMCKDKQVGDVVDGYKSISKDINISPTTGYKILGYLVNNNYINSSPTGTILLKNIGQIK
jgi:hypothetical protein